MTKAVKEDQLKVLLARSRASAEFKASVLCVARGQPGAVIKMEPGAPLVKILRVVMQVLETYPEYEISEIEISGRSTCSAYSGYLIIEPRTIKIEFDWDCRWKAEQEGWLTWYGVPDQGRAAQTFGYQCFRRFQVIDQ